VRENVVQLQSTNIYMLWGDILLHDAPLSVPPTLPTSEPSQSVQPSGDDVSRVDIVTIDDSDVERERMIRPMINWPKSLTRMS